VHKNENECKHREITRKNFRFYTESEDGGVSIDEAKKTDSIWDDP
jgi:hypothetical protein